MAEKRFITEDLQTFSFYDMETSLDTIIQTLQDFKEKFGDTYSNIRFNISYDRYDDEVRYLQLQGDRLETDAEFEKRVSLEKKDRIKKKNEKIAHTLHIKEERRKLYTALKKEFGDE